MRNKLTQPRFTHKQRGLGDHFDLSEYRLDSATVPLERSYDFPFALVRITAMLPHKNC